jgi:hypothetical protein
VPYAVYVLSTHITSRITATDALFVPLAVPGEISGHKRLERG